MFEDINTLRLQSQCQSGCFTMERIFTLCNKDLGEEKFRTKTSIKSFINQKGTELSLEVHEPVNTTPNSTLAPATRYTASPV